jgi:hypothetical protein
VKLHPESGLPDEIEPDTGKPLENWIEGFKTGRLDPEVYVPRIYKLAYASGFAHARDEIERQRKQNEKN